MNHDCPGWHAIRAGCVLCLLLFAAHGWGAPGARAEIYALLVGVDHYEFEEPLRGAVNDAVTLADALRTIGARKITTLLNTEADHDSVFAALDRLASEAPEGSVIVFGFAGHGTRLFFPASSEAGQRDNVLVFSRYLASATPLALRRQMIVDDEIRAWVKAHPKHTIVAVFDTCHSGTMNRGAETPTRPADETRYRDLPPLVLPTTRIDFMAALNVVEADAVLPHEIKISAGNDEFRVPEIADSEGRFHGALSWALAKGLRGAADTDADGLIGRNELRGYLVSEVGAISSGVQTPDIDIGSGGNAPLFVAPEVAVADLGGVPPLPVRLDNGLPMTGSAVRVTSGEDFVLRWLPAGDVQHREGERVGVARDAAEFARIVEKWRTVTAVNERLTGRRLDVDVAETVGAPGKVDWFDCDEVFVFRARGLRPGARYAAFNLASEGTVQFHGFDQATPAHVPAPRGDTWSLTVLTAPPFGADHWLLIEWPVAAAAMGGAPQDAGGNLVAWLRSRDTRAIDSAALIYALGQIPDLRVGVMPVYTRRGGGECRAALRVPGYEHEFRRKDVARDDASGVDHHAAAAPYTPAVR